MKASRKRHRERDKDFPKKKIKVGKEKRPPDNATVVSFKAQSVVVPTQLDRDETQPATYRRQSLQDLLKHLSHPTPSVRCDSLNGLRSLFLSHPSTLLPCLGKLFQQLSPIFIDQVTSVRHSLHLLLKSVLPQIHQDNLAPFFSIFIASVKCGLTHITSSVQMDTLKIVDLLLTHTASLLQAHMSELLPLYISLMSCYCGFETRSVGINGQTKLKGLAKKPFTSKLNSGPGSSFSQRSSWQQVLNQLLRFLSLVCLPKDNVQDDKHIVLNSLAHSTLTFPSAPVLDLQRQLVSPSHEDFFCGKNSQDMSDFLSSSMLFVGLKPQVKVMVSDQRKSGSWTPLFHSKEELFDFTDHLIQLLLECWVELAPSCLLQFNSSLRGSKQSIEQPKELLETILQLLCMLIKMVRVIDKDRVFGNGSVCFARTSLSSLPSILSSSTTTSVQTTSLLSSLSAKHLATFKNHFMVYFPCFEESGESSSTSLLMNIHLSYMILALHCDLSQTTTTSSVLSYLTLSLPRVPDALDSLQLQKYTSILVSLLEIIQGSFKLCGEEQKELLGAIVKFFKQCHPQSSAKQTLLVYFKELMETGMRKPESMSLHVKEMLLQPCLSTIPRLLCILPVDASPSIFKLLLELLCRAASCMFNPVIVALHTQLPALLSHDGPLFVLPLHLQTMLLHLLGHIPKLKQSDITFLARLASKDTLPMQLAIKLIYIVHHKLLSTAEEAKYSTPGACLSFTSTSINFLLSVLIGYSQEELEQLQLSHNDTSTESLVLLYPSPGATVSCRTKLTKVVIQCLTALPLSKADLLLILKPTLSQLLSSVKFFPCDAGFSVLWLATELVKECVLPDCLTSLLASMVLSCLVSEDSSTPDHLLIHNCFQCSVTLLSLSSDVTKETIKLLGNISNLSSSCRTVKLYCRCLVKLLCDLTLKTSIESCLSTLRVTANKLMGSLGIEDSYLKEQLQVSLSKFDI